ncbi:MAG: hypothetical protein HQ541_04905 [Mariniphaga sp.]|nr:hypothetical protein [Mariniphaga sp.]
MDFNRKNINAIKYGFHFKCLYILIDGFRLMKADGKYELNWEEEQLTATLIHYIKGCPNRNKWKIHIEPEIRNYTHQIIDGSKTPKTASRIDMKLFTWQNDNEDIFMIEAKNIRENNWINKNGKLNYARRLHIRFIETGIEHIISGHYPLNSCICGYILEGKEKNILEKLNKILKEKRINNLYKSDPINNHLMIYNTNLDSETKIKHIFLSFNMN